MSQTIDKGGPAFPTGTWDYDGQNNVLTYQEPGMTMRDFFASHANPALYKPLETLTAKLGRHPSVGELADYIADVRFVEADAMLKARES